MGVLLCLKILSRYHKAKSLCRFGLSSSGWQHKISRLESGPPSPGRTSTVCVFVLDGRQPIFVLSLAGQRPAPQRRSKNFGERKKGGTRRLTAACCRMLREGNDGRLFFRRRNRVVFEPAYLKYKPNTVIPVLCYSKVHKGKGMKNARPVI